MLKVDRIVDMFGSTLYQYGKLKIRTVTSDQDIGHRLKRNCDKAL